MDETINIVSAFGTPEDYSLVGNGVSLTVEVPERVGKFEIVGFSNFFEALQEVLPEADQIEAERIWDNIQLPTRATSGSAGYDFHIPYELMMEPGKSYKVPTGIRVKIDNGWFLACFPRSGLGFKYRLQLDNTVGIIDSDYYYSDNEGQIFARITADNREGKSLVLRQNDAFMQGIFLPYGITVDDNATGVRNGGFGSTGN